MSDFTTELVEGAAPQSGDTKLVSDEVVTYRNRETVRHLIVGSAVGVDHLVTVVRPNGQELSILDTTRLNYLPNDARRRHIGQVLNLLEPKPKQEA